MKPLTKFVVWGMVTVALVCALALPKVWPRQTAPRAQEIGHGDRDSKERKILQVSTYVVRPMPLLETVNSTGTLRADEGVELQAEASGKVVGIYFVEGHRVRKGDLLLKVNDAELRATLARATSRKDLAEAQERRLARLLAQKVVTQVDYDTVASEVHVQEAEIAIMHAQIAKTEIRAPFDGVVGLRFVSIGAYLDASTRVATLQQLDRLKIDFSVPEKYAGRIRPGNPVTFTVAGGAKLSGEIYAVEPRIDSGTRTLLGRAVCPNDSGRLLPGAFASVEIILGELRDALLIPAEAIVPGMDDRSVFVKSQGKAERRRIEAGTRTKDTVQVLSGLSAGEEVITSGLVQLRPGQSVVAADKGITRVMSPL